MGELLAFDVGGTHIKFAIVDKYGKIVEKNKAVTPNSLTEYLTFIENIVDDFLGEYPLEGIAISSPGAVSENGVIYGSSAIPYIHGPNMKKLIENTTRLPVEIENDANCAALAEVWRGAAQGRNDVAVVVLGTGVGGAIIKNGTLHKGVNLHAGEFGYMIINSSTLGGGMNTFSELASTSSIIRRVARRKNVRESSLTGEEIFHMAKNGDPICLGAIKEFYHHLAVGIYNIQFMYDPELILIGGAISNRDDILDHLKQELEVIIQHINIAKLKVQVDRCHYNADANLIGAIYHYLKRQEK